MDSNNLNNLLQSQHNIGITFITLSFIYLIYVMNKSKKNFKLPKPFLLIYGLGGFILGIKNLTDNHKYIAINEFIGCTIAFYLFLN